MKEHNWAPRFLPASFSVRFPLPSSYEDDMTIAFLDAGQVNSGRVIVATKSQVETILDLDDETAVALFRAATRIAGAVEAALDPDGITVLQANKPAGWQTVPHVHLHVLPRQHGDGVTSGCHARNRR